MNNIKILEITDTTFTVQSDVKIEFTDGSDGFYKTLTAEFPISDYNEFINKYNSRIVSHCP